MKLCTRNRNFAERQKSGSQMYRITGNFAYRVTEFSLQSGPNFVPFSTLLSGVHFLHEQYANLTKKSGDTLKANTNGKISFPFIKSGIYPGQASSSFTNHYSPEA